MFKLVNIPRSTQELQQGGCWWLDSFDSHEYVAMSCPECEKISDISNCSIDNLGRVQPSVVCPHGNCNFDEFVCLLLWE